MAVYDRTNTSSTATATMPSKDLGSVIIQSLQSAVESIKGENSDETSLKESIQQGIDDSAIMKSLKATSTKISESFKKTNTKAQGDKNSPSDKVSKNMDDIAGLLKTNDKREKDREKEAKVTKKAEKNHKASIKEGFSAVKAFGSAMLQKIGLVLIGLQLVAELIVLIKYGWHYLMGVFIPKTWVKIKTAWTGFWTKITTELRNFFVGLFKPIAEFFGVKDFGLSPEDKVRKAQLLTEMKAKDTGGTITNLAAKKTALENQLEGLESRLKGSDYSYLLDLDSWKEIKKKSMKGEDVSSDLAKWKGQWLGSAISSAQSKGDTGNLNTLTSIQELTKEGSDFQNAIAANKLATEKFKDFAKSTPEIKDLYNEYKALNDGLKDVEVEVNKAKKEVIKQSIESKDLNAMTIDSMAGDKSIGGITKEVITDLGGKEALIDYVNTDDKHFKWLNNEGYEWRKTMTDLVNHTSQNIGLKVRVDEPVKYLSDPSAWKNIR